VSKERESWPGASSASITIVGAVSLNFVIMGLWVGPGPTMAVYTAEFGSLPTMR
jgi:hypothetical protein